jgi:hypothetical protein
VNANCLSFGFIFAPLLTRNFSISLWPFATARKREVRPFLSFALTSAPFFTRDFTSSRLPLWTEAKSSPLRSSFDQPKTVEHKTSKTKTDNNNFFIFPSIPTQFSSFLTTSKTLIVVTQSPGLFILTPL